jgi:hypothetical protein
MAITEGLTVFNLVDGIVDEFEDESGVDNSASTSLTYNSTDDYYINSSTPDGDPAAVPYSAGFTTTTITEPDTSVAGTNPGFGTMVGGTFTVPTGATSVNAYIWGAGGGAGGHEPETKGFGGGGGGSLWYAGFPHSTGWGARGAVRIIWGNGRYDPSTNTANV